MFCLIFIDRSRFCVFFFFSSRRRHTRSLRDWSSDVCSSDLAAVAAGLVLQVVEPHLNGPGGEVPIIAHAAGSGETFVLCGQGTAPAAATPEAFAALGLDLIPGNGLLAACVPGAFGAWMLLLRDHGAARLRDVLSYAIEYAGGGYPMVAGISHAIAGMAPMFREHWPSSAEVYLPGGEAPAPGARFSNPQ